MSGMRYSVQFERTAGEWIHWRACQSQTLAIEECDKIATRKEGTRYNARVKDVLDWHGPSVAYREASKT